MNSNMEMAKIRSEKVLMINRTWIFLLLTTTIFAPIKYSNSMMLEYDILNRLIAIHYDYQSGLSFSYDATGNRTSRVITTPAIAAPALQISFQSENLILQWNAISGATSYRVQSANWPGGPWSTAATVTGTAWSTPSTLGVRLFRVVAIN